MLLSLLLKILLCLLKRYPKNVNYTQIIHMRQQSQLAGLRSGEKRKTQSNLLSDHSNLDAGLYIRMQFGDYSILSQLLDGLLQNYLLFIKLDAML